jgi:ADP-heptose:LPS heptosyltransferase
MEGAFVQPHRVDLSTVPSPLAGARRILVIRHRAAGDLLLTTPAFRALRAGLPACRIEVLVARGQGELLEGNVDVDEAIEFDRRSIGSQLKLYARLARGGWDAVIDLVSNPRSAWMTALTRARVRAGYAIAGRDWAYTHSVPREPVSSDGPRLRYAPEAALDIVRALGISERGLDLTFHVSQRVQEKALDAMVELRALPWLRQIVLCHPGGSWPSKTWIPGRFTNVMDLLAKDPDVRVVWMWGPGERELAEQCQRSMDAESVLAPAMGWQEMGAWMRVASVWVGNDSGPKHLAVALGVPTVTVFGPTHPTTWHPPAGPHRVVMARGLACLHCNANVCPLPGERFHRCMRDVTVEDVVRAVREVQNPPRETW